MASFVVDFQIKFRARNKGPGTNCPGHGSSGLGYPGEWSSGPVLVTSWLHGRLSQFSWDCCSFSTKTLVSQEMPESQANRVVWSSYCTATTCQSTLTKCCFGLWIPRMTGKVNKIINANSINLFTKKSLKRRTDVHLLIHR